MQLQNLDAQQKVLIQTQQSLSQTLAQIKEQNTQTISNLTDVQQQLEMEKQDRLNKASQRVQFLEQKVKTEDELCDHVNTLERSVALGSSQLGQSGLRASSTFSQKPAQPEMRQSQQLFSNQQTEYQPVPV